MHVSLSGWALPPAISLLLTGCIGVPPRGEPREETRTVSLGNAERANVRIEMKAGELRVSGGAGDLLQATFQYDDERWKPEVRYDVTGFRGNLTVRQRTGISIGPRSDLHHEWDLKLSDDVPMDLDVSLGAGRNEMDLRGMQLRQLDVRLGAGELDLNLTGPWKKSFETRIRGGVGKATVRLPKDVGVQARARGGIGEIKAHGLHREGHTYTNDVFDRSPVTLRLDIEGGIGEIRLELEG